MAFDVFVHRGNAFYAMFAEIQATVTDQAGALQEVRDNNLIVAALPTINALVKMGAKVVLFSHLG